jgi:peptidoglycan/xylan/chitin deacetylase (PgdA/CDA1 family)
MELLARKFHPVALGELVSLLEAGRPIPRLAVCVTFDDGYANCIRCGLPTLSRCGVPATLFVTAGLVDTRACLWHDDFARAGRLLPASEDLDFAGLPPSFTRETWRGMKEALKRADPEVRAAFVAQLRERMGPRADEPGESRIATTDELGAWIGAGMEVGSHTVTHAILTQLHGDQLDRELTESKRLLEAATGKPVESLAYPDGAFSAEVREATARAGYRSAVVLGARHVPRDADPLALPRYGADSTARLRFVACGLETVTNGLARRVGLRG